MVKAKDMGAYWFKNREHEKFLNGPHTGTGNSGKMMAIVKLVFRTADGKEVKKK